ncbi:hypothetical protein DES53_104464 [Roseimicrobium gellanilyticum]|uniref:Uncharacterized protein n=1 Tax=Roseimicrobium gellanilyticum TaxID=748857 RepID=A0A366HN86_9BACT|nr:hypothetical protein [Roseimicrobium gellanilyticum]RBP44642.1 hypothetical protein DES53_104464 [Roseimicrobium gellanilyticum]
MPGENVSVVAFGQYHTDEAAMKAVREKVEAMHEALKREGKELVIGIEHSDVDVRKPETLTRFYNESLVQKYCDEAIARGETPTKEGFRANCVNEVNWNDSVYDYFSPKASLQEKQKNTAAELLFSSHEAHTREDVNKGKGAARMEEARLLIWAKDKATIRGLDPVSDADKRQRLTGGSNHIHGGSLEDMEYERVQGMGQKAAAIMKDMAGKKGGCLVAINMGAAHMGSMEVSLRDQLEKEGLDKAQVNMCVMVPQETLSTGKTAVTKADELMRVSVNDMQSAHARLERQVGSLQEDVVLGERLLSELNDMVSRVPGLPANDTDLRALIKDKPAVVAKMLNHELSNDELDVSIKRIKNASARLERGEFQNARDALTAELRIHVQKTENGLNDVRADLEDARRNVQSHRDKELAFSDRVEKRLDNKPGEVFTSVSPSPGGQYDLSGIGQGPRQSVRDSLGLGSSHASSSNSVQLGTNKPQVSVKI